MARFITAIVLGYLVMLVAVMGLFALAFPMLGVDRLFEPGTYEAARGWILLSFAIGITAAMAGGALCARIAPGTQAPLWLAAIVLVLGGLMAIPVVTRAGQTPGSVRPAYTTMADAIQNAVQPSWVAVLNPIVGALGVLMGAGPRSRPE